MTGERRPELAERLGRYRTWGGPEMSALAEAVGDERIAAVAVGTWRRRGWMIAATDRELHMSRRPKLLGRNQQRRWPWSELRSVEAGPARVDLAFAEETVELQFVGPRREFDLLVETARAAAAGSQPETLTEEVRELARLKLGRMLAYGYDPAIEGLPSRLDGDERVERLAVATLEFTGLLAVTDRRVILINAGLRRGSDRVWEIDRDQILGARPEGDDDLRLDLRDGPVILTDVLPPERRDELATVLRPV